MMLFEQLNPYACKTYLLGDEAAQHVVLIDPVIDHFVDYLALLERRGLTLTHVIDTHTHADHISAGPSLRDRTDCDYVLHENAPSGCATIRVRDGDRLSLNGIPLEILHTPGHTQDSVSILAGDKLFTGDFLFLDDGGGGRDDLPGGDPGMHWDSLQRLSTLPDTLMIYPAHEYHDRNPSTLGQQRVTNPHLAPRTREEFVQYLEDLKLGPADWMKDVLKANYACATDPGAAWIPADSPACAIKGTMDKNANAIAVDSISAAALQELLQGNDKPMLIDVREARELDGQLGRIHGAVNIPIASLASRLDELSPHKNSAIVLVCRSGARAMTGAKILMTAGFGKVRVLAGGMATWNQGKIK